MRHQTVLLAAAESGNDVANRYRVRFSASLGRALVLHMTRGTVVYTGEARGPGLPFGAIDLPQADTTCAGAVLQLAGWALDDTGVRDVAVARDAFPADSTTGLVSLGAARRESGTRPDVAEVFMGFPHTDRAGWAFELPCETVRLAPEGALGLHVIAVDQDGQQAELGVRIVRAWPSAASAREHRTGQN